MNNYINSIKNTQSINSVKMNNLVNPVKKMDAVVSGSRHDTYPSTLKVAEADVTVEEMDLNLDNEKKETIDKLVYTFKVLKDSKGGKLVYKAMLNLYNRLISIKKYQKFDYSIIREDGYYSQGITEVNGKYYISAYTKKADKCNHKDDEHEEECMSRIYIYDKNGNFEGKIILNTTAHVGGISYDKDKGILFVAGSGGTVDAYDTNVINGAINEMQKNEEVSGDVLLNLFKNNALYEDIHIDNSQKIMENTSIGRTSTLYYYDGYLYAATFGGKEGELVKLEVKYDENTKKIEYVEKDIVKVPRQVQGIAVTEYKGKKYLLCTQWKLQLSGSLFVYELNEDDYGKMYIDPDAPLGNYPAGFGAEGIQVNDNGSVVIVREYSVGKENTIVTSMNEILNNLDQGGEPYPIIGDIGEMVEEHTVLSGQTLLVDAWDSVTDLGVAGVDLGTDIIDGTIQSGTSMLDDHVDYFTDSVDLIFGENVVTQGIDDAFDWGTDLIDSGSEFVTDAVDDVVSGTAEVIDDVVSGTVEVIDDIGEGAINVLTFLNENVNWDFW